MVELKHENTIKGLSQYHHVTVSQTNHVIWESVKMNYWAKTPDKVKYECNIPEKSHLKL